MFQPAWILGVEDTVEDLYNINYLRPVQKILPSKEVVGRNNQNSATFLQILHGILIVLHQKKALLSQCVKLIHQQSVGWLKETL